MKSHSSRFLHHSMSYSGLTRISRWKKFANWFDLDTPIKSECDSLCAGRSMVEMLGVLAIIGVLSVGAIAGYGKAMFKYKLNKQTEQLNQLINTVTQYYPQLHSKTAINLVPILKKLNVIPKEMIKYDNSVLIYDSFNNAIEITTDTRSDLGEGAIHTYALLRSSLDFNNSNAVDICRNTVNIMKENRDNLWLAETWSSTSGSQIIQYAGDKFCTGTAQTSKSCLKYLDLEMADKICRNKAGDANAHFSIWWLD